MRVRIWLLIIGLFAVSSPAWAQQTCKTDSITATTGHLAAKANANGTVVDSKTKLMWKRCPEGSTYSNNTCTAGQTYTWTAALNLLPVTFAGYTDWRLPNIKELHSIVEEQCFAPACNLTVFPAASGVSTVWSNSPCAASSSAWYINFSTYGEMSCSTYDQARGVLLVRDCVAAECN